MQANWPRSKHLLISFSLNANMTMGDITESLPLAAWSYHRVCFLQIFKGSQLFVMSFFLPWKKKPFHKKGSAFNHLPRSPSSVCP